MKISSSSASSTTKKTDQERRQFIATLCALGLSPALTGCQKQAHVTKQEIIIGAQGSKKAHYSLSWFSNNKQKPNIALSGFRGHGAAQHPAHPASILMFGRRPSTVGIEVDLKAEGISQTFHCAKNRHFFGHGCFNKTGSLLFTTEADTNTSKGKIGIRDAQTYQQIGEYESHGIGPHELALMPDGKTLVVANGGILTRPRSGRKKLNLDTMDSRLSYIDLENGTLLDDFKVAEPKASIRHLDVIDDGTVVFAMQLQREATPHNKIIPLGGVHHPTKKIQLFEKPDNLVHAMNDYMGSIAINSKTRTAGFTSPRGNIVAFWDIDSLKLKGYHELSDVCGIAVTNQQNDFVISNSFGQLRYLNASSLKEDKTQRVINDDIRWDNHLMMAQIPG